VTFDPLNPLEFGRQVRDMNARIARRRDQAPQGKPLPIASPPWADAVVDTGDEVIAIHTNTAEPYPLDVHADLTIYEHAVVVVRRVLAAGGTQQEVERLVMAFGLDSGERRRLLLRIREELA
jgi:hypothetical protein